jgi:hypothetical protein
MRSALIVLVLGMLAERAIAGGPGCPHEEGNRICQECRAFYAEIARRVPAAGANLVGLFLVLVLALGLTAIFIDVRIERRRRRIRSR